MDGNDALDDLGGEGEPAPASVAASSDSNTHPISNGNTDVTPDEDDSSELPLPPMPTSAPPAPPAPEFDSLDADGSELPIRPMSTSGPPVPTAVEFDPLDTDGRELQLPPMPTSAPPVPPAVGFDPFASTSLDTAAMEVPSQPYATTTGGSTTGAASSVVVIDADLLGTGEGMDPAAAAAQAAALTQTAATAISGDGTDDSGSEYETDDDDDDMIVGFGRQTARMYADFDAAAAPPAEGSLLPCVNDNAEGAAKRGAQHEETTDHLLRPGDHVYSWVNRQQRHGIILSIGDGLVSELDPNDFDAYDTVAVVTFYSKDKRDRSAEDGGDHGGNEEDGDGVGGVCYTSLSFGDVGEMNDDSLLDNADNVDGYANASSSMQNPRPSGPNSSGFAADATEISLRAFCGGSVKRGAVRKVSYGSNFAKRLLSRPGSVTAVKADMPGLVLARVKFLLENPGTLPDYHRMAANGECAAVWCCIGRFITLQGSSILQIMFFGQAGGAVAGGVVASSLSVWTPMPGVLGAMGWAWYVPITVAYPIIVPLLVTFGLASLLPLEMLRRYRNKWKKHTQELNREFWLLTDEDTKEEYFGTAATANEDWVSKFFGSKAGDDDDGNHGQYMPVGEGEEEENDDLDDELERKYTANMASAYNADFGESSDQDDGRFKMMQRGLLSRWNKSLRGSKNMSDNVLRGDDAVPLYNGDYDRRESRARPSMIKKWRDSWMKRSNSGNNRGAPAGGQGLGLDSFKDFDDDDTPISQGLMS